MKYIQEKIHQKWNGYRYMYTKPKVNSKHGSLNVKIGTFYITNSKWYFAVEYISVDKWSQRTVRTLVFQQYHQNKYTDDKGGWKAYFKDIITPDSIWIKKREPGSEMKKQFVRTLFEHLDKED
jgi:hypothetical protein